MPRLVMAIPSYNRADRLDAQIARVVDSARGRWDDCRLLISDNASTDHTPVVCQKWQAELGDRVQIYRQRSNLGLIGNLCFCFQQSPGTHTWTISDDDPIEPDAVATALEALQSNQELGFLHLNYRTTNNYDGAVTHAAVYPWPDDLVSQPGDSLFVKCMEYNEMFISCLTACCVRTDLAQRAIAAWPAGQRNIAYPVFISGFASVTAAMYLSARVSLTYPLHTMSHINRWLVTLYHDLPEVYLHLANIGLNPPFMRALILQRVSMLNFMRRFPAEFLKSLRIYRDARRLSR